MPQTALNAGSLATLIRSLDRARLLDMAQRARALARPGAAAQVADICAALARGRQK
jgi:UDP-N-acetylglucosamine--N-acetylmuramyl-(pentapeptide) pyrophosphoryl-undecaprenol N-acetylglucosamine transferase